MITQQGALNTTALVVPDLYVQLVSPTAVLLNGVPSNVLGIVGSASWGPVGQPVALGTMADYATAFGPVVNRKYDMGTHVAIAVQQGAAAFRCLRVTDGTEEAATISSGGAIAFTARYAGGLGNAVTVTLGAGSKPATWAATVALPGVAIEHFDNLAGTGAAFWTALAAAINTGSSPLRGASQLVTAAALGGTTAPAGAHYVLSGGSDGAAGLTAAELLGTDTLPRHGMYALRDQGCSLLDLCDCDDPTLWTSVDGFAAAEGLYAILTGPAGDTIGNAITTKASAGLDSTASKLLFGDWIFWWDAVNGTQRLVSPQAFAAGRLANLSPEQSGLNKPLYAIAGSQKVGALNTGQSNRYSMAELQALFEVGIDVVTNPGAGGQAIWTLRLGHNSSSDPAVSGDTYTRLTNYIAATLATGMGQYVGRVIGSALLRQIRSTLMSFLAALQSRGMIGSTDGTSPFAVICDTVNNPPTRLALGYVQADVQIRYQGITEKFLVNLDGGTGVLVTSTGSASGSSGGGSGTGGSGTTPTPAVTLSAPATATVGTALSLTGTVTPGGDPVSAALSSSATVAPTTGLTAATVSGDGWSASLTPTAAGVAYAWAKDLTTGQTAVSAAITVDAAVAVTVTWNLPPSGTYAPSQGGIGVNAFLHPGTGAAGLRFGWSSSATVAPASWTAGNDIATEGDGDTLWAAFLTAPATAGTYYAWAQTTDGAAYAVTAAVTVGGA